MSKKFGITPEKLEKVRGRFIAATGRRLSWKELAHISGVSQNTFSNIINGRTNGSMKTATALIDAAPQFGVVLHLDDIITPL